VVGLTWERIISQELEVDRIIDELARTKDNHKRRRQNNFPKARLCKLVGWSARNPKLRSQRAYKMTMSRMWELLL
jgi:hypothetical protein